MKKKLLWLILLALICVLPVRAAQASLGTPKAAPRVVDNADLFTDEEEALILQAIQTQSARGDADIVVVTDSTSDGKSHMEYADDFYDNNGYGFGVTHDGILLFICMEPGNRGFWTTVTGRLDPAVSSGPVLYTEEAANALDDALYEYMVSGRYAEGVIDWVGNVGTWLVYGVPFAPLWYPTVEEQTNWVRSHNSAASRIADDAGLFTGSEASSLEQKAAALADSYGTDVVIHTARSTYGMSRYGYAQAFYQYGGYGLGSDYSGILLVIFSDGSEVLYTEGKTPSCLDDEESVERLLEADQDAGSAAAGAEAYLTLLEKALKNNRIPHSTGSWIMSAVIALLAGLIPGAISRGSASASMKTVRTAFDSNDYLVNGSFRLGGSRDDFIDVTTTRVYSPESKSRESSSGGGGGSTYSGGHTSSSGVSHSGSGRKF